MRLSPSKNLLEEEKQKQVQEIVVKEEKDKVQTERKKIDIQIENTEIYN